MFWSAFGRSASAILIALSALTLAACGQSAQSPYEFVASTAEAPMGVGVVDIRLKNTKTDMFVNDAVIEAERMDMAPDGMRDMMTEIVSEGVTDPGVFRFKVNMPMKGRWQLSLVAQVPGESGPVRGSVTFTVQ